MGRIEDELDFLNVFHASGLRVMQLTYNARNRLGDGCFEPSDAGLQPVWPMTNSMPWARWRRTTDLPRAALIGIEDGLGLLHRPSSSTPPRCIQSSGERKRKPHPPPNSSAPGDLLCGATLLNCRPGEFQPHIMLLAGSISRQIRPQSPQIAPNTRKKF